MKTIFLICSAIVLLICCKGPQGDPGPQGNQGIPGEKGATGAAGANGANGANGENASPSVNIEYSKWTNYKTGWTGVSTAKRIENIKIDPKRQIIANYDILLVFVRKYMPPVLANWNEQILLPSEGKFFDRISYTLEYGGDYNYNMAIYVFNSSTITNAMLENVEFRWFLISPSKEPNGRLKDVDFTNYKAVQSAFNITD